MAVINGKIWNRKTPQTESGEDRVNLLSKRIFRKQSLDYLQAAGLNLCLRLNVGKPRLEIERNVLEL